jgi:hypothetical protein
MADCNMDKKDFRNHMIDKCEQWSCTCAFLGEDFVVFEFEYEYRAKEAEENLANYAKYYGWRYNRGDKALVIINKSQTE